MRSEFSVYLAGFAAAVEVADLAAGAVLDVAAAAAAGLGLDAAADGFGAAAVLDAPAAAGAGLDAVRVGAAPTCRLEVEGWQFGRR